MSGKSKTGWGGTRQGAGRKKETLSTSQVREMLATAKEMAKKHGRTIDDILLEIAYGEHADEKSTIKDKLAAIKLFKEYTIAKLQEGGETDNTVGPEVFIPEMRPELKAIDGGKEK